MKRALLNNLAGAILAAGIPLAAQAAKTTINTGGSSIAAPTYIAEFKLYTSKNPSILWDYTAAGAGPGQLAFLNNDITQFTNAPAGTLTYGTIVGTQVDVGTSDAFLLASQLTNPATGSYANSSTDGPLIQLPTFGLPIAIAYNESGETGTLQLTDAQVCGVLSGEINDWHTLVPAIPAGTTINVVYFSNSSGATFLTTQHLNKACTSSNSTFNTYPVPITKSFVSLFANNTPPANFTGANAASGASAALVATSDSLGYLTPDYTSIAPNSANTTSLKVASLVNATDHTAYAPTVANTETGLAHPGAGSTNATPPATLAAAQNPLNWIPAIPQTTKGYPIVGYSTWEVSTCYANKTAGTAINTFLTNQYGTTGYLTVIKNNGFVPLVNTNASPYINKVKNIFLSNKTAYNLNIDNATTCASYAGR